jgi:hemerythrin-like domain-containing protein
MADNDHELRTLGRRAFVFLGSVAGAALFVRAARADSGQRRGAPPKVGASKTSKPVGDEGVAPPEDLMREHGVLKRVMLVYEEGVRRIDAKQDLPPEAIRNSADIIRRFIEDYHEKLEEDYLFPRFEKAGKLVDLTTVLRAQHQGGRRLTDQITQLATLQGLKDPSSAARLKDAMQRFNRMYSPHEAREDTVLFHALRELVSKHEFAALGEQFEKKEHDLFGEEGFEKMVDRVAGIEKSVGIYDLSQFTPK